MTSYRAVVAGSCLCLAASFAMTGDVDASQTRAAGPARSEAANADAGSVQEPVQAERNRLSLHLEDVSLLDAIRAMSEQGVALVYSVEAVEQVDHVSCRCPDAAVEHVLETLLHGTPLGFDRLARGEFAIVPRRSRPSRRRGVVRGRVQEEAGAAVVGAVVQVEGATVRAVTDYSGLYTLRGVPAGTRTLIVSSLGYTTLRVDVFVAEGSETIHDVTLEAQPIELGEVVAAVPLSARARALNQQMNAPVATSIASVEQIRNVPDASLDATLRRMPGMTRVSGLGAATPIIEVNGQRLASTEIDGRTTDVSSIATDMVEEIRVSKSSTPDMPGDATGGKIEVVTRRPIGSQRIIEASLSGGVNWLPGSSQSSGLSEDPTDARASVNFGTKGESFSYFLGAFYRRDGYFNERLRQRHAAADFGSGTTVVPGEISLMFMPGTEDRYGVSADFDFYPSRKTSLFLRTSFTKRETYQELFQYVHNISRASYASAQETESLSGQVTSINETRHRPTILTNVTAGGEHALSFGDLDYSAAFAFGKSRNRFSNLEFRAVDGFGYTFDISDRRFPRFALVGAPPTAENFSFTQREVQMDEASDAGITATVNLRVPVNAGALVSAVKLGARIDSKLKSRDRERERATATSRPLTLADFTLESADVLGRYSMPFVVRQWDESRAHAALDHEGVFQVNENFTTDQSNQVDFDFRETISAAYAMLTTEVGALSFLGGLRIEHTLMDMEANVLRIGEDGALQGIDPAKSEQSYTELFPSLHLRYQLGERSNIRAALTRTIARPRYKDLSPTRYEDLSRQRLTLGNGDLRPMRATNFDFFFEHYLPTVGVVSIGVFTKEMKDFVFTRSRTIDQGEYEGWEEVIPVNGDEGRVYGYEVAWQQNLSFLPGALSRLSVDANYTWTGSSADYDRDEKLQMLNVVPHVANAAISFRRGGFSSNVAYQWRSSYLTNTATTLAPEILDMEGFYGDRYYAATDRLDISVRQRIRNAVLFLDVRDLLDGTNRYRYHGSAKYPFENEFSVWSTHVGVRLDF